MNTLASSRQWFFAIILFGLIAMTARHAVDPDLWWHLRTGELIVTTGQVPHSDPFSFTRAGQPWISHEWLSEVLFYELWKHAGAAGLILFSAIVTAGGFLLLYLRCPGPPHWAAAATVLAALASAPTWGTRPQMFTFFLFSLLLVLLEAGEHRHAQLFWILPIFLLWLNLHAGFAVALALLFGYGAGLLWEAMSGQTPKNEVHPRLIRVGLVLLACLALVPLNPAGAQLYRYPLGVLRSAGMRSLISEWASPDFHQLRYGALLFICLAILVAFACSRSRPKARVMVPLLGALFAALDAQRHIPILVLLAAPVLASALRGSSGGWQLRPVMSLGEKRFRVAFHGVAVALVVVFALARLETLARTQERAEAEQFPMRAADFLAVHGQGRLFAYYDWGGYAIWRLYPGYRVFVDGRADLYGDDLLKQFQTAAEVRTGWLKILQEWHVRAVLVPTTCALAQALPLDPAWHARYSDSRVILFEKVPETFREPQISYENAPHKGKKVKKFLPDLT